MIDMRNTSGTYLGATQPEPDSVPLNVCKKNKKNGRKLIDRSERGVKVADSYASVETKSQITERAIHEQQTLT